MTPEQMVDSARRLAAMEKSCLSSAFRQSVERFELTWAANSSNTRRINLAKALGVCPVDRRHLSYRRLDAFGPNGEVGGFECVGDCTDAEIRAAITRRLFAGKRPIPSRTRAEFVTA